MQPSGHPTVDSSSCLGEAHEGRRHRRSTYCLGRCGLRRQHRVAVGYRWCRLSLKSTRRGERLYSLLESGSERGEEDLAIALWLSLVVSHIVLQSLESEPGHEVFRKVTIDGILEASVFPGTRTLDGARVQNILRCRHSERFELGTRPRCSWTRKPHSIRPARSVTRAPSRCYVGGSCKRYNYPVGLQ